MRLIDADELIEHAWRDKLDSRELIAEMIEKAPTIKEVSIKIPIDVFEKLISQEPVLDKLRAEITTLQNRCYALTKGTMCAFCKFECKYKAECEDKE